MNTLATYNAAANLAPFAIGQSSKRIRQAIAAGEYAYANRKGIQMAATKIQRAFRKKSTTAHKRRKFSTDNIGFEPGSETSKRYQALNSAAGLRNSRTLYSYNLSTVPLNTSPTESINSRERQLVNLKGFKICLEVKNESSSPMYWNWAIIAPREAGASIVNADFFRGNGLSRTQDFSTDLTGNQLHCLPINTDKYTILQHQRHLLNTGSLSGDDGFSDYAGSNFKRFNKYIPINRQLRYKTGSNFPTDGSIWMVHWASFFMEEGAAPSQQNAYKISEEVVTYFKEPSTNEN
jgi:hypothetical protein